MDYENGLTILGQYVAEYFEKSKDSQLRDEFDSFKSQLLMNFDDEEKRGSTERIRADRNRILDQLNRLARRLTKKSFSDLCQEPAQPAYKNGKLKKLIHNRIKNATVKVFVDGEFQGTGFIITRNGYVLTAFHCIEEYAPEIVVETYFGEKFNAQLDEDKSLKNFEFDIAVLKVLKHRFYTTHCLPLGLISDGHGTDKIVAVGYPALEKNPDIGFFPGKLYRFNGNKFESDAMKGPGQSGGPVYHYAMGRVIGLTSAGYEPDVMINTGVAARFAPLFDRWPELKHLNQGIADFWEEHLEQCQIKLNETRQPLYLQLEELMPLMKTIPLQNNELKDLAYKCAVSLNLQIVLPTCNEQGMLTCLLKWLAKMPVSSTGSMPILDFVARLRKYAPAHQEEIKAWIDSVARIRGLDQAQINKCFKNQSQPIALPPYLLIELSPKNKNKDYAVQAWLFKSSENIRKVYVKKGVTLNDIPALTEEILGTIDHFNVNHRQLIIEFILPRHLLCHNVEHWTDGNGDPIGTKYQVVVRSRERLREKKLQRFWIPCWNEAKKKEILQEMAKTYTAIVPEKRLRKISSLVDAGKLCFVLASVPNVLTEQNINVFFALTKSGVPIALWPRKVNNVNEFKQQLSKLLSCTLEQLPQCIFKIRRDLWQNENEQHTGYHLSLLWDDPDRIPPDFQNNSSKISPELQKLHAPN